MKEDIKIQFFYGKQHCFSWTVIVSIDRICLPIRGAKQLLETCFLERNNEHLCRFLCVVFFKNLNFSLCFPLLSKEGLKMYLF